jgi:hypothetical protein
MEDALCSTWRNMPGGTKGYGSTIGNLVQTFKKELHKIRSQNKIVKNSLLGSTCTIDLPFSVETDMVVCEPVCDETIGSVVLYVVLKKQCKNSELYTENKMAVRMSSALSNNSNASTELYRLEELRTQKNYYNMGNAYSSQEDDNARIDNSYSSSTAAIGSKRTRY